MIALPKIESMDEIVRRRPPKERSHINRRQFLKASMMSAGIALGGGLAARQALAASQASGLPKQLPYGSPFLADAFGVPVPFYLPFEIDPFLGVTNPLLDPSTFANFNGVVGVVEAEGVSGNNSEGMRRTWGTDIRFMRGVFVDRDGRTQRGTFGFF